MNRYLLRPMIVVVTIVLVLSIHIRAMAQEETLDSHHILYINSYHEGYKWSDDIGATMEATFAMSPLTIDIETFYLDTQRLPSDQPDDYFQTLSQSLAYKIQYRDYDLIITSDDAAYQFINQYSDVFDLAVPHLFCGLNNQTYDLSPTSRDTGGVMEYLDIEATLSLISQLQPDVRDIYYITDHSLTGQATTVDFLMASEGFKEILNFHPLTGENMTSLMDQVALLPDKAAIVYLVYYFDQEGTYYDYDQSIQLLSQVSSVPIYSLWDFYIGNGVMGGKMTSGETQGELVADMALSYMTDMDYDFTIKDENRNMYIFDYEYLDRFNIDIKNLPSGSEIINYRVSNRKEVLILHSYDSGFQWTDNIDEGIRSGLEAYEGGLTIYTEYMDLKQLDNQVYLNLLQKTYNEKYRNKTFDLIVTSDDGAFEFAQAYMQMNFGQAPIVFCGVNYLTDQAIDYHDAYTGIMESYDIRGTLDAILALQTEVTKVLVINDQTVTGLGNRKNVETVAQAYQSILDFEYTEALTMTELASRLKTLSDDTAILLMTFNKDATNGVYSYAQSIEILREASVVPMYGVWDFYLGEGIVGGYLTDGHLQGYEAGLIGVSVLEGKQVRDIPIVDISPNRYAFDQEVMDAYDLDSKDLPKGAELINRPRSIRQSYNENRSFFNTLFILLILTIITIIILLSSIRKTARMNRKIKRLATYDHLTGVLNRGSGIKALEAYSKNKKNYGQEISICFMDLNKLKEVNDRFGHGEGDHFIKAIANIIANNIRDKDIFCRMGGDEFMVAFLEVQESVGKRFVVDVKKALEEASQVNERDYDYSMSIGVHHFTVSPDLSVNVAIEMADTYMYLDKADYRSAEKKLRRSE